eukprot:292622_1
MSNCTICLDALLTDLQVTRCGHCFHSHCITQWLNTKNKCPICNKKMKKTSLIKLFLSPSDCNGLTILQKEINELRKQINILEIEKLQLQTENNELNRKFEQQQITTQSYIQKNIEMDEECDELKNKINKLNRKILQKDNNNNINNNRNNVSLIDLSLSSDSDDDDDINNGGNSGNRKRTRLQYLVTSDNDINDINDSQTKKRRRRQ